MHIIYTYMHIIYTWHISFIFSTCDIIEIFGPLFHRSVKRERKCSALRWVGNRKCKIKGGGESHVWSTHHCSHMHVSSLLWDEEKISVCWELEAGSKILKILWKVHFPWMNNCLDNYSTMIWINWMFISTGRHWKIWKTSQTWLRRKRDPFGELAMLVPGQSSHSTQIL